MSAFQYQRSGDGLEANLLGKTVQPRCIAAVDVELVLVLQSQVFKKTI